MSSGASAPASCPPTPLATAAIVERLGNIVELADARFADRGVDPCAPSTHAVGAEDVDSDPRRLLRRRDVQRT